MPKVPHVALLIETSRACGRGLLRGINGYLRARGPWCIYAQTNDLGAPPPRWLRNWNEDGIRVWRIPSIGYGSWSRLQSRRKVSRKRQANTRPRRGRASAAPAGIDAPGPGRRALKSSCACRISALNRQVSTALTVNQAAKTAVSPIANVQTRRRVVFSEPNTNDKARPSRNLGRALSVPTAKVVRSRCG
jgi:hypothetical protein